MKRAGDDCHTTPREGGIPLHYQGRENDLTQELMAYYELAASSISDPARLEHLLDELCAADDVTITNVQSDAQATVRRQQIDFVRRLLKERGHAAALHEVYGEAMDQAYAAGAPYYAQAATALTHLHAEADEAMENQRYHKLSDVLADMKDISDRAATLQGCPQPGEPAGSE